MGWKAALVKPLAKKIARDIAKWSANPIEAQQQVWHSLLKTGSKTAFGKDHGFQKIKSIKDFQAQVPVRDYEGLRPYVDRVVKGESDILWAGRPKYFAKTSGTTSGVKYIPLTKESIPNHFGTARNALFNYFAKTGKGQFLDGKMIFLSGSPEMDQTGDVLTGRLSGIVNHQVPGWLRTNQLPSYPTNCIDDWETKVQAIVEETYDQDMRLISGIPPWVQMYYERLLEKTGRETIQEIFPNFSVFVYGGVNYEPYRAGLEELVGKRLDSVETYPASEGFIAFQDEQGDPGLLLNVKSGIFFEFIPAEEVFSENPTRLTLGEVELGVNYAIILHTNAGLWGYNIGDTVQFTSLQPYKIVVSGRIKHFISAFGEHVIGKEVESALLEASTNRALSMVEFTVAPQVNPTEGLPFHEWLVEFEESPTGLAELEQAINEAMTRQNIYYRDLIEGKILRPLRITPLPKGTFRAYMKTQGKLGGQNKVPRLANDRKIAEQLLALAKK